jgi:hypothetical protein
MTRVAFSFRFVLLLAVGPLAGGCTLIGYTAANLAPKPRTSALYHLPKDQTVLVFPDDVSGQLSYPLLKQLLAEKIGSELHEAKGAKATVPYVKLYEFSTQVGQRWYRMDDTGMGVAEVTRALGADMAVYVSIRHFQLKDNPGDPAWKGKLNVFVKVVSAQGKRLWPTDRTDGYELSLEMPASAGEGPAIGPALAQQLAEKMAVNVVDLFRSHVAEEDQNP